MPGAQKLVENANQLKERVDELQKKVRGLDALERRVDSLEKKVDELSKASKPAARSPHPSGQPPSRSPSRSPRPGPAGAAPAARPRSAPASCPGCSPSSWTGKGSGDSTSTTAPRRTRRLRVRQVRAAVGLRQRQQQVALRQVADQEDVEPAVVGLGLGQHLHPAAEVAAVGDDHVVHAAAVLLAVDANRDLAVPPAREDGEGGPGVRDLAAERLRGLVGALGDRAAHAGARDVREQRLALGAVPAEVVRPPEVDHARAPAQRDLDRGLELRAGCRRCGRSPSPSRAGSRRARRRGRRCR